MFIEINVTLENSIAFALLGLYFMELCWRSVIFK